jgi:hypothetical protein
MPNIQYSKVLDCKLTTAKAGANPYIQTDTPYCTFFVKGRVNPIVFKGRNAELQYKAYLQYKRHRGQA